MKKKVLAFCLAVCIALGAVGSRFRFTASAIVEEVALDLVLGQFFSDLYGYMGAGIDYIHTGNPSYFFEPSLLVRRNFGSWTGSVPVSSFDDADSLDEVIGHGIAGMAQTGALNNLSRRGFSSDGGGGDGSSRNADGYCDTNLIYRNGNDTNAESGNTNIPNNLISYKDILLMPATSSPVYLNYFSNLDYPRIDLHYWYFASSYKYGGIVKYIDNSGIKVFSSITITPDGIININENSRLYPFQFGSNRYLAWSVSNFPTTYTNYINGVSSSGSITLSEYESWLSTFGVNNWLTYSDIRTIVNELMGLDSPPLVPQPPVTYSPKYIYPDNTRNYNIYLDFGDDVDKISKNFGLSNLISVLSGLLGEIVDDSLDTASDLVDTFTDLLGKFQLKLQAGDLNTNLDLMSDLFDNLDITPYMYFDPETNLPISAPDGFPNLPNNDNTIIELNPKTWNFPSSDSELVSYKPAYGLDYPSFYQYPLSRYFPWSIPADIYQTINVFNASPVAPCFDIPVPIKNSDSSLSTEYITINLNQYNEIMEVFRIALCAVCAVGVLFGLKRIMF